MLSLEQGRKQIKRWHYLLHTPVCWSGNNLSLHKWENSTHHSQLPVIFCQGLCEVDMVPLYLITFFGFCFHVLLCSLQVNIDNESRNSISGTSFDLHGAGYFHSSENHRLMKWFGLVET